MNFKMKAKPTPKIKSAAICGNVWDNNPDFFFFCEFQKHHAKSKFVKSSSQIYIWQILIDYSKHTLQEGVRE